MIFPDYIASNILRSLRFVDSLTYNYPTDMKPHYLWEMRAYYRQVGGEILLGSLCGLVANAAASLPAILLGKAIDTVLAFDQGQADLRMVTLSALAFLGGSMLTELPRIGRRWWVRTAAARIRSNLRADLMRGILDRPMEKLHGVAVGDLMARVIGDVDVVGQAIRMFMVDVWDTMLFSITLIVTMTIYDPELTLLALAPVPFALLLSQLVGSRVRRRTGAARAANSRLTAALQENLANIRVLRLFGRSQASLDQIRELSQDQQDANLAVVRLRDGMAPVYTTLLLIGISLIIAVGGKQVIAGAMTVGSFVAFTQMFLRFSNRSNRLPRLVNNIQSGAAAFERLRPWLADALPVRGEPRHASFDPWRIMAEESRPEPDPTGMHPAPSITLRNVSFYYPHTQSPVLKGINLEIAAGEFIAVTGPVGCGKSALMHIILGEYPIRHGEVLWDDRSIESIPAEERATRTGYLAQDAYLFSGSVAENIAFDRKQIDIQAGIQLTALEPDLETFPQGVETQIGEQGMRVSGGQRQRIALARALATSPATRPGLILLDDPFSAVDLQTEQQIIRKLRSAYGPRAPRGKRATIVLASHRLLTFPLADRVIVLNDARIVEMGRHAELLAAGGLYAQIFDAQSRVSKSQGDRP
jgi:ABC-type multidrug transport system fused ATPase/permease subunit